MARVVSTAVFVVGIVLAAALVGAGVVLVVATHLAPASAAIIGIGALVVSELGVAVSRAIRVTPIGRATQVDRVVVLIAVAVTSIVVAVVAVPVAHPKRGGVVIGVAGVIALVTLVGLEVAGRSSSGDQP
jgi:hypothetical protein